MFTFNKFNTKFNTKSNAKKPLFSKINSFYVHEIQNKNQMQENHHLVKSTSTLERFQYRIKCKGGKHRRK